MADGYRWAISVRELAEFSGRRGDLIRGRIPPAGAAQRGAEGHRWLQSTRPEHYRPEVSLTRTVQLHGIALEISGRADGIYAGDPPVLEEIKTTTRELIFLDPDSHPVHWSQACIYGAIHAATEGLPALDIQLTYLQLDSREVRSVRRSFSAEELEARLEEATTAYLDWVARVLGWRKSRNRTLAKAAFPFAEYRPGQEELVDASRAVISDAERLFVRAPTGSGKTMAVLFGALGALAGGEISQVVFLTAKTVGRLAAEQALALIAAGGAPLKGLTLTARSSICTHPDHACTAGDCPLATGHYDRLRGACDALFDRATADRAAIEETAEEHGICPYLLSRELVPWADVVICDLNYVFDPRVCLATLTDGRRGRKGYLVDEAHNLTDRAREMFSATLSGKTLNLLVQKIGAGHRALLAALERLAAAMTETTELALDQGGERPVLDAPPRSLFRAVARFAGVAETMLAERPELPFTEELTAAYFEALAFAQAADRRGNEDVIYAEERGDDLVIKLFCLDPSRRLNLTLDGARSGAVFFSATLAPLHYFARVLGGNGPARHLIVPSPFHSENCFTGIAPNLSTRFRDRARTVGDVAALIRTTAEARQGRYLAYFPSYDYLELARRTLSERPLPFDLVVQKQRFSDRDKARFLDLFDGEREGTLVGLAVLGGLFSEGIDLEGDRLSGAIVVSPGLPRFCLERELIRDYFNDSGGSGFEYAYLYPGMNKAVQAAGRVIRSESDRGVVIFVGERFARPDHAELLPEHWAPYAHLRSLEELASRLARFWEGG